MVDLSVLIITLMLLLPAALGVALFAQQQQERRLLTL